MTEKLYYQNTDQTEFAAQVLEAVNTQNTWQIVLDKTCFFPEGGGQPADKGWLNDIPVLDVRKEADKIIHFLPESPAAINETVKGKINPAWRNDFMQQHTGQHIISGALWTIGKYKTVSVHLGLDYTTVEIETPEIPEHDLIEAEKLANRVITGDIMLEFIEAGQDELEKYNLRRPTHREGKIRLVKIGDFDCSACGGLHLESTRLVGLVKATGIEKIRGNTRIAWKIGERAYADYRKKDTIIAGLKSILSTNEDTIVEKIKELMDETGAGKKKYHLIESRLAELVARDLYQTQMGLSPANIPVITASWHGEEDEFIKKIMKNLLKKENTLVCLVNILAGKVQWYIGCSGDVAFQFNEFKDHLLPVIEGKGGGRHPLWQGTGLNPDGAAEFLEKFKTLKNSR